MAGCTPADIKIGIKITPTAAVQPAALGIAMLTINVAIVAPGISKKPIFFNSFPISSTKCLSHPVYFITKAKPIQEHTEVIKPAFVMLKKELLTRFLRYTSITSQSDAKATVVPSTDGQWELAKLLKNDLLELGLVDLKLSPTCVLTGRIPSNLPSDFTRQVPKIGFVAHLDTVDVSLNPDLHPQLIKYTGGDVLLNKEHNVSMGVNE